MSQISGPNFGGPVSGNKAGEIFVGIAADLQPLRRGLRQAEAEVKAADARMKGAAVVPVGSKAAAFRGTIGAGGVGMGPGAGVSSIGPASRPLIPELDPSPNAPRGWLRSLTAIRSVMSRLFLPAALVAGVSRMVTEFDKALHFAEDFGKELEQIASGPAQKLLDTLIQVREAQGAITESTANALQLQAESLKTQEQMNGALVNAQHVLNPLINLFTAFQSQAPGVATAMENLLRALEGSTDKAKQKVINDTEQIIKLLDARIAKEKEVAAALVEQERIQKRIREQAKRDITHTVIDAKRLGPALDLLQRQRTTN